MYLFNRVTWVYVIDVKKKTIKKIDDNVKQLPVTEISIENKSTFLFLLNKYKCVYFEEKAAIFSLVCY